MEKLQGKVNIFEVRDKTEYGRKEITIHDCYNYQITFFPAIPAHTERRYHKNKNRKRYVRAGHKKLQPGP